MFELHFGLKEDSGARMWVTGADALFFTVNFGIDEELFLVNGSQSHAILTLCGMPSSMVNPFCWLLGGPTGKEKGSPFSSGKSLDPLMTVPPPTP